MRLWNCSTTQWSCRWLTVFKHCSCCVTDVLLCSLICINPSFGISVPKHIQPWNLDIDTIHSAKIVPFFFCRWLKSSVTICHPLTQTLISNCSSFNQLRLCSACVFISRRRSQFDNTACAACVNVTPGEKKKAPIYLISPEEVRFCGVALPVWCRGSELCQPYWAKWRHHLVAPWGERD